MIERRKVIAGALVLVLLTSVATYGLMYFASTYAPNSLLARILPVPGGGPAAGNSQFNAVYQYIKRYFVDVSDDAKLMEGATAGMVQALGDPYSYYMDPKTYKDFTERAITGQYSGIGVSIEFKNNYVTVIRPFKGTPAEQAGMRPGDQIVAVDGKSVVGMALDLVRDQVRGTEGTSVKITVLRPGVSNPIDLDMKRATIQIPTVTTRFIENDIAYVQIESFDLTTDKEFADQLTALQQKPIRGMILDLRYNPGGTLDQSVAVAEYFVPSGPIVTTVDRAGNRESRGKGHGNFSFPVVVLVNEYSASASEVVTGAIQDAGTATIIGGAPKTFGKGSVQVPIELDQGAALRLTIARWLTPKDRAIDKVGLQPDIVVAKAKDETVTNMDSLTNPAMVKAIEVIKEKAAR